METEVTSIESVPGAFLSVGVRAFLLLLAVGLVLAVGVGMLGLSVSVNGWNWLTLALMVGALTGLVAMVVVLFVIRRAVSSLMEYFRFEQRRMERDQDALLREREPQPFVVQDRIIPVNKPIIPEPPETINGIPAIAWEYFVGQLCRGVPISQNHWDRHQLPGGYEIASFDSYSHLVDPLVELGIIADRDGERRKSGRLTTTDPAAIMAALRDWERNHERRS